MFKNKFLASKYYFKKTKTFNTQTKTHRKCIGFHFKQLLTSLFLALLIVRQEKKPKHSQMGRIELHFVLKREEKKTFQSKDTVFRTIKCV